MSVPTAITTGVHYAPRQYGSGVADRWAHAAGRRFGVLMNLVADDVEGQARLRAFQQNLQQLGWSLDHNLLIDDAGLGPLIAQKPNRHMREKSRSISLLEYSGEAI